MAVIRHVTRFASRLLSRRVARSIPWVGGVIALATLGSAVRRKGLARGTLHSALDGIPYVGGGKNLVETVRGRDFFPDKAERISG
jgi:hypothetical protein